MKKNMKKLASLLLMAMLVLGLTACGSKEESNQTVVDEVYAESLAQFFVSLTQMPTEEMQYYLDMDAEDLQAMFDQSGLPIKAEAFQDIFSAYVSDQEVYGVFDSIDEDSYKLESDKETVTQTVTIKFEDHDATLKLIYDEDGVITTGSMDPIYSMGEILQKAGLNTVIGMGTVFMVLVFISLVIALLPKLTGLIENAGKKKETAPAAQAPAVPAAPVAETEELVDDLELVAVISAAIAAYTGTSSDGFVVRSIKRSKTNKWKKA